MIVYDSTKLKTLSGDSTVIVMNYIFKNEGELAVVITKVLKTNSFTIL